MKQVPYYGNPDNVSCALACYTMAAQYLFPENNYSFDQMGELADRKPGYVVWGFKLWKWLIENGLSLIDYDIIDYEAWVKNGVDGLKSSLENDQWIYLRDNSFDLDSERDAIAELFKLKNFRYIHRRPTWEDVVSEHSKPGVIDVTLNSRTINKRDGFAGHRVVITDIDDDSVCFNDPNPEFSGANRREPLELFRIAFVENPELARYSRSEA